MMAVSTDGHLRMWFKRRLMGSNRILRRVLFCNRAFIKIVFGVEVVADPSIQSYCEWATVLMRFRLGRYLRPGHRVLDLGTGAHAILAVYAKKVCSAADIVSTDILPERVEWARRTIARNGVQVDCREADLFEGIPGRFDLILLTPPAIPSGELESLGYHPNMSFRGETRYCWSGDGGEDGLAVIRPFLAALSQHLAPGGRAIVCVNPAHCGTDRMLDLIHRADLNSTQRFQLPGIMTAYIITADVVESDSRFAATRAFG